jgi:hypothetical protein
MTTAITELERAARRPSWLVSALPGLTVICCLIASTRSTARQTDAKPDEIAPIKEVANRLEKSIDEGTICLTRRIQISKTL